MMKIAQHGRQIERRSFYRLGICMYVDELDDWRSDKDVSSSRIFRISVCVLLFEDS